MRKKDNLRVRRGRLVKSLERWKQSMFYSLETGTFHIHTDHSISSIQMRERYSNRGPYSPESSILPTETVCSSEPFSSPLR